jgi:hypothetical protein
MASLKEAFANVEADETSGTRNRYFMFIPLLAK